MKYQGITNINNISTDVEILNLQNNQIDSLKGIPSSLPFLKSFTLQCDKLESFKFLPKTLPNLQNIEIKCKSLKSLEYLPQQLPSLTSFIIEKSSLRSIEKILINFTIDLILLKLRILIRREIYKYHEYCNNGEY